MVVGTSTGFQSDLGRWQSGKGDFNPPMPKLAPEDNAILFIDAV